MKLLDYGAVLHDFKEIRDYIAALLKKIDDHKWIS